MSGFCRYKSIIGLDLKQMGRSDGFCAAAIQHDKLEVLVVEDALLDARSAAEGVPAKLLG